MGLDGPLTSAQLAAREIARLCHPGSVLLDEHGIDEGAGHGFGDLDRSALLRRWWRTEAPPEEILGWFASRLRAEGWVPAVAEPRLALFLRGPEQLFVAVRSIEDNDVLYEVGYSDQSETGSGRARRPR